MLKLVARIPAFSNIVIKKIHTSALCRLREIIVEKPNEKTTVIDCQFVESPRKPYLIKLDQTSSKCPLCQLQLNLKYTDVLILCQYITSEGKILKRGETHLCKDQYKLVSELIYMAQHAGLLPEPPQAKRKKPYQLLNTYYDETTINLRPVRHKFSRRFYHLKDKLAPIERYRVKPEVGYYYGRKY